MTLLSASLFASVLSVAIGGLSLMQFAQSQPQAKPVPVPVRVRDKR